jgi:hypothetical protein
MNLVPRVVHCKRSEFDVMIDRDTKWGNPFGSKDVSRAKYKVGSRDEAIKEYSKWILKQDELMSSLHELKGKTLGCWCKPKRCHGDVLVSLVSDMIDKEESPEIQDFDIFS